MILNTQTKQYLIGLSLLTSAGIVQAGSMGEVASPTWTGFYVGLNEGGIWGETEFTPYPSSTLAALTISAINTNGAATLSNSSLISGLQLGANYQFSSFVLGVEGDFNFVNLDKSREIIAQTTSPTTIFVEQFYSMNWFSTVRGRLGYATDSLFIYGTGGWVFTDVEYSDRYAFSSNGVGTNSYTNSFDGNNNGWTAGAGVEWKFMPNLSLKAEYLYVQLDKEDYQALRMNNAGDIIPASFVDISHEFTANLGRIGLNYTFG